MPIATHRSYTNYDKTSIILVLTKTKYLQQIIFWPFGLKLESHKMSTSVGFSMSFAPSTVCSTVHTIFAIIGTYNLCYHEHLHQVTWGVKRVILASRQITDACAHATRGIPTSPSFKSTTISKYRNCTRLDCVVQLQRSICASTIRRHWQWCR